MNDDDPPILPDGDPDRRLARDLGDMLARNLPPADADPPRLQPLAAAGQREADALRPTAEATARMWAGIEQHLDPAPRSHRTVIGVAAGVGVVLALTLYGYLLGRTDDPRLLLAAAAEVATYTATDGSVIRLRPHSRLYAIPGDGPTRYRLDGEAFFDLVPEVSRTVAVETDRALLDALGARFNLSTWGRRTVVYLVEGRVRLVHRPSGRAVALTPGRHAGVTPDGRLIAPVEAPADEYTDWLRDALLFQRRPLRQVLAEMEHHFSVTLDVPPALLDEQRTGRIPLGRLDESLADLGALLGGRFEPAGRRRYRFVPE